MVNHPHWAFITKILRQNWDTITINYIYILYPRNNGWFMISGLPLAGFMGITDYPRWCLRDLLPGSLWHPPDGPSNFNETWKKPQPLIPYFSRLF
jgi:hypothetical protein